MKNERYEYIYYSKDFDTQWCKMIEEYVELLKLYIGEILDLTFYIGSKKCPTTTYPCLIQKVWKDTGGTTRWINGRWDNPELWMVKFRYMVDSPNSTTCECSISQIVDMEEVTEEDSIIYKIQYG